VTDRPEELPEALQGLTADEAIDPIAVVSHELHQKSRTRRTVEIVLSLSVVVVIFVFVIPAVTGSHYSEIWSQIRRLQPSEFIVLFTIWAAGMLAYTGVLINTLPGLRVLQALCVNFAGSAVSNVMPFGGALGVGATYAIDMSWGFSIPSVTLSILVSGIWNVFAKLGMPILALVLLLISGNATGDLLIPALLGLVALVSAATGLVLIMRSEQLATRIAQVGQRVTDAACRLIRRDSVPDVVRAVLDFRHHSTALIHRRWMSITLWIFMFNLIQYLLLLACVRAIGLEGLTWIEVFAAFAFARLLETIPITPSGVGFVETGAAGALVSFGGNGAAAAAAIFLFRGFVYLLEIPMGAIAWIAWASVRSWRRPVGSAPSAVG
jgi:uncharacterized protein (TIRG00374 family)